MRTVKHVVYSMVRTCHRVEYECASQPISAVDERRILYRGYVEKTLVVLTKRSCNLPAHRKENGCNGAWNVFIENI